MIQRDQYGRKITPTQPPQKEAEEKAAPPAPPRPTPTIRVTPSPPPGRQPSRPIGTVALLLALGGLAAAAFWYGTHRQDPNFLQARQIVADYEISRPPEARNYGHSVYAAALDLLANVDPGSVSATPARSFKARLERDIREFEKRQQAKQDARTAALKKKKKRDEAYMAARYRAAINPVTEYPECEDEEGGHRDHKHD